MPPFSSAVPAPAKAGRNRERRREKRISSSRLIRYRAEPETCADTHTIKKDEYTWVAMLLQDKLRSLGYLNITGPSTGYYGEKTVKAVKAFQKDAGLPVTGEADEATQRRLLEG